MSIAPEFQREFALRAIHTLIRAILPRIEKANSQLPSNASKINKRVLTAARDHEGLGSATAAVVKETSETYADTIEEQYEYDIGWTLQGLIDELTAWAPLLGVPAVDLVQSVPSILCQTTAVSTPDNKRTVSGLAKRAVKRVLKEGALARTIQEKATGAALFTKNPGHLLAWDQFCLDWAPHQAALERQAVSSAQQLRNFFADILPKKLASLPPLPTSSSSSTVSGLSPSGSPIVVSASPQRTRYILALDGGGMRGVSLIGLLYAVELALRERGKSVRAAFDLICGTSTGSIIASALTALNLDPSALETFYLTLGKELFSKKKTIPTPSFYDPDKLETLLKSQVGEMHLKDLQAPKVFAVSYCLTLHEPYLFRSYPAPPGSRILGNSEASFWAAARASSAAPPFFTQFFYIPTVAGLAAENAEEHVFLDGGIGNNNPLLLALEEARQLWPNDKIVALSLGTGNTPMEKITLPGAAATVTNAIGLQLEALAASFLAMVDIATASSLPTRILDDLPYLKYLRLEPKLTQAFLLDETRDEYLALMLYTSMLCGMRALPALQTLFSSL